MGQGGAQGKDSLQPGMGGGPAAPVRAGTAVVPLGYLRRPPARGERKKKQKNNEKERKS